MKKIQYCTINGTEARRESMICAIRIKALRTLLFEVDDQNMTVAQLRRRLFEMQKTEDDRIIF